MIKDAEMNKTQIIIGRDWRRGNKQQVVRPKTKRLYVFENVGNEKNRYPGSRKCIFLINLI